MKLVGGRVDLEQGDVGRRVLAHHLGADRLGGVRVAERHLDLCRAVDDMGVGEDVAVVVDHEAGARRGPAAAAPEGIERRGPRGRLGLDEGDAGRVLLVDLVDRQALPADLLRGGLRERCGARGSGPRCRSSEDWTQPAAIAIKPTTATTSPPISAAPREVPVKRRT